MATILHVNHGDAQNFVQDALGDQYNLISATDAPTAIQYCAMIQPDLILMDLDLPHTDGHELTTRLKMFMPQTPIIVFSNNPSAVALQQAKQMGADDFLAKPIVVERLKEKIQELLPLPFNIPELQSSGALDSQAVEQLEAQISALNRANKRLASLNAVSALIGTSIDLDYLTDQILGQIQKTIEFDSATLFLLKGNFLEAAASRGLSEHQRGMNIFTKSERNSAWRVVENKLPLIINNVLESEFWEPRPELSQVRSWLGVPLIYKDRVVGVLTLDKNEVNGFNDSDARYVFTLAYQIAITVENAQLFEEWESQAARLKLINEVAQEITTLLDVDSLFEALALALYERLNYDSVAIFEVDRVRSLLTLKAYYGLASTKFEVGKYQQNITDTSMESVVSDGTPILANDIFEDGHELVLKNEGIQAELLIPIFLDQTIEAVVVIQNSQINQFGDKDLWTLSSLASQTATIIQNARLYHDIDAYSNRLERIVEARTQRLQAIRKISHIVSQGLNVEELLPVVGGGIGQIFSSTNSADGIQVRVGLINGSRISVRSIYGSAEQNGQGRQPAPSLPDSIYRLNYRTVAGQVVRESKSTIVTNFDPKLIYTEKADDNSGTSNALMIAPLVTAGKTIGVIVVESLSANTFDDSDLETLEILAFHVASAIEHARLLRKTRELAIVDERTRLARDMHDGVAQNLAYLLIQVDRCLSMVDEDSKLGRQLDQVSVLLTQNIEEIRRNIFDLRPVELEGKSLFEMLENFVAEFGRRWNKKTECHISGEARDVPTEVESSIYRIIQEALSNARQHADCSRIRVELEMTDTKGISLMIADDGTGFDVDQTRRKLRKKSGSKGLGLTSIRERAESVGGQLTVETDVGRGTRILAWLPLHPETAPTL